MRKHLTADELQIVTAGLVQSWRDHAACKGRARVMDPPHDRLTRQAIRQARAICADCPVLTDCARWVLGLPAAADPGGICGGMTEAERAWHRLQIAGTPAKQCTRCQEVKPTSEYYSDSRNSDGLASHCKDCNRELSRAGYHERRKTRTP